MHPSEYWRGAQPRRAGGFSAACMLHDGVHGPLLLGPKRADARLERFGRERHALRPFPLTQKARDSFQQGHNLDNRHHHRLSSEPNAGWVALSR